MNRGIDLSRLGRSLLFSLARLDIPLVDLDLSDLSSLVQTFQISRYLNNLSIHRSFIVLRIAFRYLTSLRHITMHCIKIRNFSVEDKDKTQITV